MGANFIDYIIADKIIADEKFREFYSEKIINMPHSFMPTDNTRKISIKELIKDSLVFLIHLSYFVVF